MPCNCGTPVQLDARNCVQETPSGQLGNPTWKRRDHRLEVLSRIRKPSLDSPFYILFWFTLHEVVVNTFLFLKNGFSVVQLNCRKTNLRLFLSNQSTPSMSNRGPNIFQRLNDFLHCIQLVLSRQYLDINNKADFQTIAQTSY